MASIPSFNFMNSVAQSYNQVASSIRNDLQDYRSHPGQVFMPEMPKSQPPLRRDKDNAFLPYDSRLLPDNFQYLSDNSEEEGKGVGGKIDEPYFRTSYPMMVRHQDMYPQRSSSLLFQTNTENGGGMNRLNMAPPRSHDTIMENQYRKIDFPHNNQY